MTSAAAYVDCCTATNRSRNRCTVLLVSVGEVGDGARRGDRPDRLGGVAALGLPFLGIKWGFPDDRVLPNSSSAHQIGDRLREGFADNSATAVTIVVPDAEGLTPADFERYAAQLSRVVDVTAVSAPSGTFTDGNKIGPPAAAAGITDGSAFLTVGTNAPLFSPASATQLDRLHEVATPGGRAVEFTGIAQINRDSVDAITSRLPLVLAIIAVVTFVLLFLLTGSVVLPAKALILNVLSLTAAFGALVWIFQDGHLGAFGTTPTGTLVANMPVLLFCIAFGLSMDYEVFLVSRIREFWLESRARRLGRQRRKRGSRSGPHRSGRHSRGPGHVDLVRRDDRRPGVLHADVRGGPDVGDLRGRHPGPDGSGAGVHAHPRAVELVGTRIPDPRPPPHRYQRIRLACRERRWSAAGLNFLGRQPRQTGPGYECPLVSQGQEG